MFEKESAIYITAVPFSKLSDIHAKCRMVIIEHVTEKAVLVRDGDDKQWFPRKIMKRCDSHEPVFLIPKWFKLDPSWSARVGRPVKA